MATVLVVDDDPDSCYFARALLEADGHQVHTTRTCRRGLATAASDALDLALVDVVLADGDGWEVLEAIKSHPDERVRHVKVLMTTAVGSESDRMRSEIEGALRYLVKPIDGEALRRSVAQALTAGPEPEQRRAVQTSALEALVRQEKGLPRDHDGPRPRLSALEHARPRHGPSTADHAELVDPETLTERQQELLGALASSSSVSAAAAQLGVSRSNVYASLRRVGRKLDVDSVPELLHRLRSGLLAIPE